MSDGPSFGWIAQPALFETPAGVAPHDVRLAHELAAADDQHVALVRALGWDTIWVEDHLGWGDKAHLECFTTMAWLAGCHPGLRWGTMVCGQAFRNPGYLAKLAVNMHVLTEGRFILGLGAGNNGAEHAQYGIPFLPPAQRLDQTEEVIRIVRALWTASPATVHGRHYRVDGAFCAPLPERPIPLMIGGGGERRTLRLAARYADWWCADVGTVETFAHKNRVLDEHCAAEGRDPRQVVRSQATWISVEDDPARVVRWPHLHIVAGTPEEVAAELAAFVAAGVEHFQVRFMDYPSTAGLERFAAEVQPRLRVAV
jgi:alkanesulfonate monooxygenase SsuD/methylene tetrahydromethanopterin reductase-like flavin-dependent oxidoreductase (luciferase family)